MFKRYVAGVIVAWLRRQDEKHKHEIAVLEEQIVLLQESDNGSWIEYCDNNPCNNWNVLHQYEGYSSGKYTAEMFSCDDCDEVRCKECTDVSPGYWNCGHCGAYSPT